MIEGTGRESTRYSICQQEIDEKISKKATGIVIR